MCSQIFAFDQNISYNINTGSIISKHIVSGGKTKTMENTIKIQDFYFAAFLLASGHNVLSMTAEDGRTVFEFEETWQTRDLLDKYYDSTTKINPVVFGAAIRSLKSMIHSKAKQNGTIHYVKQSKGNAPTIN